MRETHREHCLEPQAVANALYTMINARRLGEFDHLVHRRFEGHGFAEGGREEWKRALRSLLRAFPDLDVSPEQILTIDQHVVARLKYHGTQRRSFAGVRSGRSITVAGVDLHVVRDGRIASTWSLIDLLSLAGQLTEIRDGRPGNASSRALNRNGSG